MTKMKRIVRGLVLGAIALTIAACGTMPGPFNGLGSDYMTMLVIYRTDHQPLTYTQYLAVQDVAKEMHMTLAGRQLSGPLEAGLTSGGAGAAAGAAGGATQGLFYAGAMAGPAAGYTAAVYGLGYVVNGLQSYSYAQVFAQAQMVETTIRDREKYDHAGIFARLHVVGAFVRSRNNINSPAPGLRKQMPDFTGPISGTVTK